MLVRAEVEPDRVSHALSVIERNAMAQARLVDDLLDLSLMTRGQLRLKIAEIDVASLVNDALEAIAPSAQAKGVSLRVQVPPLLRVYASTPSGSVRSSGTCSRTRSSSRPPAAR